MGKRQHQKDKMYLTYTEWSTLYGGKKTNKDQAAFRRLPYDYCAVSLQPFENPYCDRLGNIFELQAILSYHKKYKVNPVTGKPLDTNSLVKLKFHKDHEGHYQCPVLYKSLTPSSHIVAIAVTGNVFLYEAVEQLNLKTRSLKDLLSDEPFKKDDIITLQDPSNLLKFNIAQFHHVINEHKLEDEEEDSSAQMPEASLKTINKETRSILDELNRDFKPAPKVEEDKKQADKFNAAHYSTGKVAASFTSTALNIETKHEPAIIEEDLVRYDRVKKKGYVRLSTNFGHLNLELHCDLVPKTCENFIKHCHQGYYDGTLFHRSIRHFMIQGGDPTGTGKGGESIWKKPFKDEIKPQLVHTGRGILSMANSGPNTNLSQFFITYRSCRHLDGKHTVFGHVVGGLDTLNAMEKVEVDNKDRPIEEIKITKAQVFVDPFQEADEKLALERGLKTNESSEETTEKPQPTLKKFHPGVGKYINPELTKSKDSPSEKVENTEGVQSKKKRTGYNFGNFSGW